MIDTGSSSDRPLPRQLREQQRLRRAAQAASAGQESAMAIALAQIGAAFDEAAASNAFKIKVERLLRLGPLHPTVRARLGVRAELLFGSSLDAAVVTVERWWRRERSAFAIASAFGRRTRLSLDVLAEMRLILRLLRRKRVQEEYAAILEALCEIAIPAAAK